VINDRYAAEINVQALSSIAFVPWPLARDASRSYSALTSKMEKMQGTAAPLLLLPFPCLSAACHFIILLCFIF
jgi:hypothetical protein